MLFAERLTREERNRLAADILTQCERAALPKLPMEQEEIYRMWRRAKYPKKQIKVLADLCVCDKSTILAVLRAWRKEGDPPLPEIKEFRRKTKWQQ